MHKMLGPIPFDQITLPGWMPWWATGMRLRIGATLSGGLTKYGLPKPEHAPGQSHPVQSSRIRERLRAGAVTVHPAIERFEEDRVRFVDGTSAPCDLVVWATGYKVSFPFLDESLLSAPNNELPLYKRVVHPQLPGLYFVGLLQPVGAVMPLAEAQSRWIAALLQGKELLPSSGQMARVMQKEHERYERRFYRSPRHTMQVDFDGYLHDLSRARRKSRTREQVRA